MKNFNDIRSELKDENPSLFFTLEIMGKMMSIRTKKGISQRELSKLSGVPQKTISRLENGLDYPRLDTLGKLAYALDVKIILVEDNG